MSAKRPDVAILNSERDLRLGGAAAALAGVKVRVHRKGISGVKNNPRYRWTYRNLRTHTICVADAVRREIAELDWVDPASLKVLYSGVDLQKFTPNGSRNLRAKIGASDGDLVIGAVARLSSIKGFEYVLDAMPEILDVSPNTKALFAGIGRIEDELKARAEKTWINEERIFRRLREGRARRDPVARYRRSPFRSHRGSAERRPRGDGLRRSRNRNSRRRNPEAVSDGETGVIVPARDASAIAKAVLSLANDVERGKDSRWRLGGGRRRNSTSRKGSRNWTIGCGRWSVKR